MSVDQDVERSMLERKDRADLVTMATALGEKPPARAKKADIVALILRLTNVDSGPETPARDDGEPSGAKPTAEVPTGERDAQERDAPAGDTSGDTSDDPVGGGDGAAGAGQQRGRDGQGGTGHQGPGPLGGERAGGAGPGSDAVQAGVNRQGGDGSGAGRGPDRPVDNDGNRGPQGNRAAGGGGQAAPVNRAPTGNEARGSSAQPATEARENDQNRPNQQGPKLDDGEPGNRRRRRRGRDRDRQGGEPDDVFVGEPVDVEGLLDLRDEGYGFLRLKGYLPSKDDVYVSVKQARQFSLRKGDRLTGKSRPASRNEKNPALLQIDSVNGGRADADRARQRPKFEDLTPLFPDEKLRLELADDPTNMTARIVDLIAPIGKGQRGLIVSPPKAGKTTVMKQVARSIEINNPEVHLIVLLVDERPEEVTDMKRWLRQGEVAASTFDRPSDEHTAVAELVIERAKRMVEEGKDVVIILDGITRLARAYNLAAPATGRIMSGGIDTGALYPPKKFFGAARNVEEGGSLTILATALVETGSRMDEVIFEEFKGTGNMELKLDRRLADRRIYPAIDVDASSTRHEELLFERKQLQQVWRLRRVLSGLGGEGASSAAGLELLIDRMKTFKSNDEFLGEVAKAASV